MNKLETMGRCNLAVGASHAVPNGHTNIVPPMDEAAMYEPAMYELLAGYNDFMAVEEVAEALNLHANTIRGMLRRGEIRGCKFGGRKWRIAKRSLVELLAS